MTADSATSVSSTVPELIESVASAITLSTSLRLQFTYPESACVTDAFEHLSARASGLIDTLVADPLSGWANDPEASEEMLSAYFGCLEPQTLRTSVLLAPVFMANGGIGCTVDAWDGVLTADLVASSIAYGRGLDDLPADTVKAMAASAALCAPDRDWWIIEILDKQDLPPELTSDEDLNCVAARYVDVMGVSEVIRRRILGAPLLALPPSDEARLDLAGQCHVSVRGTLELLAVSPGACLADMGIGTEVATVTGCDQAHNAEAVSVHDLSVEFPAWPGIRAITERAESLCHGDIAAMGGNADIPELGRVYPLRRPWEQGDRTVICLLVHADGGVWTAPSGLLTDGAVVPAIPPTSAGGQIPITCDAYTIDNVGVIAPTPVRSGTTGFFTAATARLPDRIAVGERFTIDLPSVSFPLASEVENFTVISQRDLVRVIQVTGSIVIPDSVVVHSAVPQPPPDPVDVGPSTVTLRFGVEAAGGTEIAFPEASFDAVAGAVGTSIEVSLTHFETTLLLQGPDGTTLSIRSMCTPTTNVLADTIVTE